MVTRQKRVAPSIYIRLKTPQKYLRKIEELSSRVIVEPWNWREPEPEVSFDISDCDVIFTLGVQDHLNILKKAPHVKWVHSSSVGIDAMLHEEIVSHDLIITNSKGCTSIPIAEHTMAMMSGLARGIPGMAKRQLNNEWHVSKVKELYNATLGIIGYGEIGSEIAKRAKAFGMHVIGCRRNPDKSKENEYADHIVGMRNINDVLKQSDYVVLALPSTAETINLMNKERLRFMKEGSFLINVGRGNTINDDDLIDAIREGHLAGAALDVFDEEPLPKSHPFWSIDNILISPHLAYYSPKNLDRIMSLFIHNLEQYIAGNPLKNVVNKKMGY
ncbi:D-2-hydroxyacid dehydrogenase [Bacillus cellulosilyticus]|uniref:D-isomer specific 2-hydroxyacid dehydrogenase NAD-binding protein n=1 Tax=Evansella cellulosilytica (strain ATCC 21833 / DSM 2522 / FERM P-1141 / JCM 9156 / N-4) TaxID=649639 RepID=E6TYF6_EVAC2|nr:D-isomer specific 2-hydroxyacid dehydrogenase NAD-binding protein [Evansella cellulosilytica DSM 2522]